MDQKKSQSFEPSDNDIIPSDVQDILIYWRDKFTEGAWDIGRQVGALIEQNALADMPLTNERIDRAAGRFCGKTGRTVRYYRETAMFFPDGIEHDYPSVPFTHFAVARRLGDRWKEAVEYSALTSCSEETLDVVFFGIGERSDFTGFQAGAQSGGEVAEISFDKSGGGDTTQELLDEISRFVSVIQRIIAQIQLDGDIDRAVVLSGLMDFDRLVDSFSENGHKDEDLITSADFLIEVVPTAMNALEATASLCRNLADHLDVVKQRLPKRVLAKKSP